MKVICSDTAIVAPLETLNTNLNYKILDDFIGNFTDPTTKNFSNLSFNNNNNLPNSNLPNTTPTLVPYASTNRFSVESVESNNGLFGNDKKLRVGFCKLTQYSINTITELPERPLDEER